MGRGRYGTPCGRSPGSTNQFKAYSLTVCEMRAMADAGDRTTAAGVDGPAIGSGHADDKALSARGPPGGS